MRVRGATSVPSAGRRPPGSSSSSTRRTTGSAGSAVRSASKARFPSGVEGRTAATAIWPRSTPSSPPAGAATCTSRSVPLRNRRRAATRGGLVSRRRMRWAMTGPECYHPRPCRRSGSHSRRSTPPSGTSTATRNGSAPSPRWPGTRGRGWWSSRSWPSAATHPATSSTCRSSWTDAPPRSRTWPGRATGPGASRWPSDSPRRRRVLRRRGSTTPSRWWTGGASPRWGGSRCSPPTTSSTRPATSCRRRRARRPAPGRWGSCSASRSARTSGTTSASGTVPATIATPSPTWWPEARSWSSTSRRRPTRWGRPRCGSACSRRRRAPTGRRWPT